jgi:hypothetical protein|tara:strand:- start:713 stop:967 length:255 start_codon:yes stop_codon:yes gene_type:complete
MSRSYRLEYDRYHSKSKQKKDRAARNTARRRYGQSGKDVHHKDGNPRNNSRKNLSVVSKGSNRNKSPGRPKGKKDSVKRRPRGS